MKELLLNGLKASLVALIKPLAALVVKALVTLVDKTETKKDDAFLDELAKQLTEARKK